MQDVTDELKNDIQEIRSRICDAFLITSGIIALPGLLASLYRIEQIGLQPVMAIHLYAVIALWLTIFFRKQFPYNFRASLILSIFMLIGIGGIYQFGLIAAGTAFLIISGPVASLLFGLKIGLIFLTFSMSISTVIGFAHISGYLSLDIDLISYSSARSTWLNSIIIWALAGGTLIASIHVFHRTLMDTLIVSRQNKKELEKHLINMEDTIKMRTGELTRSNEALERFANIAAHDMQSPLNSIRGYSELLKASYSEQLDEKANDYLDNIDESITHISEMINDLLGYSSLDSDFTEPELVDLNDILEISKKQLATEISDSRAYITSDTLPKVRVVKVQMVRVFQNLLSNAIKYRMKSRSLIIHISSQLTDDYWKFSVMDNGVGIEQEYFEDIFKIYEKVNPSRNIDSSGIGLAACKKIISLHGGNIWVESEKGKGSTFFFTLKAEE